MNDYITMLGTGNALATRCYNTCFTLHSEKRILLVDAGDISDLFVTHAHTDHLLGCIWKKAVKTLEAKGYKIC